MRSEAGLTLLEIMVALAILTIIMGLALFMFQQAAGNLQEADVTCYLTERQHKGLNDLRRDLRETGFNTITSYEFTDPNFSQDQDAWALATARAASREFHLDSSYAADWQGVIIYCPYKTARGMKELRRYVFYGSYTFPFSFVDPYITETHIYLEDALGTALAVDREAGNDSVDPAYDVATTMLTRARMICSDDENPVEVRLTGEGRARSGEMLVRELAAYVHPRN